jgi:hypothetical protein
MQATHEVAADLDAAAALAYSAFGGIEVKLCWTSKTGTLSRGLFMN